ncbi:MAG: DUF6449 domain-containing protein [Syntrophomonadaceae bacterium]
MKSKTSLIICEANAERKSWCPDGTSFIDTGILLNDLKRYAWIGVGYLLGMLLALPLTLVMIHSVQESSVASDPHIYLRILQFGSDLQIALLVLFPILTGLWLFRYLQDDKAADMIHTLPVKRETLYNTHIMVGIILLSLPLFLTALVSWGITASMKLPGVYSSDVLMWLAIALLFSLVFFITCVSVGMITGMSTVQGVLTVIVLALPMGLRWLLLSNYNMYTYGFAYDHYYDTVSYSLLARINSYRGIAGLTSQEIIVYLLAIVALYIIGRYLYQRRSLENAGSTITVEGLKPVFKYGVVFCCMLLFGSNFHSWQNYSMAWTYFGYLLGSLLSYFLIEMLLIKSVNVFHWKAVRGYLIYAVIMVVSVLALQGDLSAYEKRIPALADVESVQYSEYSNPRDKEKHQSGVIREIPATNPERGSGLPDLVYKDSRDIEAVIQLHQQIIDKRPQVANGPEMWRVIHGGTCRRVFLDYKLKDGRHMYRQYVIDAYQYGPVLKPIIESHTYKLAHNPILHVDIKQVKMVEIATMGISRSVRLVDEQKISEAIAALQTDVMNRTYEDTVAGKPGWASISIFLPDDRQVGLEWAKSFVNFEAWLKKNGEYEKARLMPEDIQYILVVKGSADEDWTRTIKANSQYLLELEKRPGCLKITDPQSIETCLRSYYNPNQQPYLAAIVYKGGGAAPLGGLKAEDAPDVVKKHFNP